MLNSVRKLDMGVASASVRIEKKDYSTEQRKSLAKEGKALPDGSYPIANVSDLHHAVELSGMGNDPEGKIKAHIIARAKDLGAEGSLPDSWKTQKSMSPTNALESDPKNTDTMQEDPLVDSLKVPTGYFDIMNPKKQGKPEKPKRVEAASPNPSGVGPTA